MTKVLAEIKMLVVTTFSTKQISKISDSAHEAAGRIKLQQL
jgi:hypothetical protein